MTGNRIAERYAVRLAERSQYIPIPSDAFQEGQVISKRALGYGLEASAHGFEQGGAQ